jgi:hypothetical protein
MMDDGDLMDVAHLNAAFPSIRSRSWTDDYSNASVLCNLRRDNRVAGRYARCARSTTCLTALAHTIKLLHEAIAAECHRPWIALSRFNVRRDQDGEAGAWEQAKNRQ